VNAPAEKKRGLFGRLFGGSGEPAPGPAPEPVLSPPEARVAADEVKEITPDAVDSIARIAVEVNSSVENIGARRLQTVMERILDEISFTATDRAGETIRIDAAYVEAHIGDVAKNTDLSRFIL